MWRKLIRLEQLFVFLLDFLFYKISTIIVRLYNKDLSKESNKSQMHR